MTDIPYNEPLTILSGDTITWKKSVDDYLPADGWTLTYALRSATVKYTVIATTSGIDYLVTISAVTSATYVPGLYAWIAYVTKAEEQHTIGQGNVTVLPNLTASGLMDPRTEARKIYDDLLIAYKASVASSGTMQSFSIAGKAVTLKSTADIIQQIQYWHRIVQAEEDATAMANGLGNPKRVGVRFVRL